MDSLDIVTSSTQRPPNDRVDDTLETPKPKKHRRSRYDPEPDWSAQMREKISRSQRRVGQACDRCKLKKMKCTPDVDGCGCCRIPNLACKVTDRVTGETFVRGAAGRMFQEIDRLEKENLDQKQEITDLKRKQAQLQQVVDQLRKRVNVASFGDPFDSYEVDHHF